MKNNKETQVSLPFHTVDVRMIKSATNTDWSHQFYGVLDLHSRGKKGKGVKVAVLDTGLDLSHDSFLKAKQTGRIKAVDARSGKNDPTDRDGHGTWCTSRYISDGRDVLGFSPECTLTSYKVLNDNGSGNLSDVLRGVRMAINSGAHIISTSLGWSGGSVPEFERLAKEAISKGIIWLSASGNDGTSEDIDYPALYNDIISVGSHDRNRNRSFFSDFGTDLDLYSSGQDVLGAYTRNREAYLQGTSMSTPSLGALIATVHGDIIKRYGRIDRDVLKKIAVCR